MSVDASPYDSPPGTDALTADGGIVRLRPVTADDATALTELHRRGSADSLRLRFFGSAGPEVIEQEVERIVRAPDAQHAVILAEQAGTVIGVASYERTDATSRRSSRRL